MIIIGPLDPESFSHFKKIKLLNLSFNEFEGSLPDVFDHMSNLKVLDLAGNALTGGLPDSMSCLVHLEYLKLQSNKLSGLSAHTTIIFIILILLLLLGQIPPWMKLLKSLKEVNLSKNKLN
jgi:Leucine-rich repeat (LRR) protein